MTHLTREEFKALPVGAVVKWNNPAWNDGSAQYYRKTADNAWEYFDSEDPDELSSYLEATAGLDEICAKYGISLGIEDQDFGNLQFISVVSQETTETEAA